MTDDASTAGLVMSDPEKTDGHERCGARTRKPDHKPCRLPGHGTDHVGSGRCRRHGGSTPTHEQQAQQTEAEAKARRIALDLEEVGGPEAMLREIRRWSAIVSAFSLMVSEVPAENLTWGVTKRKVTPGTAGRPPQQEVTQEAKPHIALVLLRESSEELRRWIETAHRCGVEERMANLAEMFGEQIGRVVDAILGDLDLTVEQQARVAQVVPLRMREMIQ